MVEDLMETDFTTVTELSGDHVSREQVERLCHRYCWAGGYCKGADVVEVACGTGQGVGYLAQISKSIEVGDYSNKILAIARKHYGTRFNFHQFDAMNMPFEDGSKNIIIMFEAIYYIPKAEKFVEECARILCPGGKVLIATANMDLYDFNPSPHSFKYYGVKELKTLFERQGFTCDFFGFLPIEKVSFRQKILRPIKKLAVNMNIMPKTMMGKKILKRIMFGKLVSMPAEITGGDYDYISPVEIDGDWEDRQHKVIYCCATLQTRENE